MRAGEEASAFFRMQMVRQVLQLLYVHVDRALRFAQICHLRTVRIIVEDRNLLA